MSNVGTKVMSDVYPLYRVYVYDNWTKLHTFHYPADTGVKDIDAVIERTKELIKEAVPLKRANRMEVIKIVEQKVITLTPEEETHFVAKKKSTKN